MQAILLSREDVARHEAAALEDDTHLAAHGTHVDRRQILSIVEYRARRRGVEPEQQPQRRGFA